jgi:hypothetical protein
MNTKTKDRLMTAGAVLLICAGGFVTSGCASTAPIGQTPIERASTSTGEMRALCETDMECEMLERSRGSGRGRGSTAWSSNWSWRTISAIALSALVTGYAIAHDSGGGGNNSNAQKALVLDGRKSIQPVGCVAAGCAQ